MGRFRLKRATHRRLLSGAQRLALAGFGLAVGWNLLWLSLGWQRGWWLGLTYSLPGLLGWLVLLPVPWLLARSGAANLTPPSYRLLYSAPPGWDERRARQSLLTLIRSGVSVEIIWACDGQEIGCWLAVAASEKILTQLVRDVFPDGLLEASDHPPLGPGVVILHRQPGVELPAPVDLLQRDGIAGVYFRWAGDTTAIVSLWGPDAAAVAERWARLDALLQGTGHGLRWPAFVGDNPWPDLPPFPSSRDYPGLSAVSQLERVAPQLRLKGDAPALIFGQDTAQQTIGFALPNLNGLQRLQVAGQATTEVIVDLVRQAIRAAQPACVLDGDGQVATRLARLLLREVSTGQVLLCDVERPAQSKFRLNPLWLPPNADRALSTGWPLWLRELGVTAGGLGQVAGRHTLAAVMLTALAARQRELRLDPPALREALLTPDFLATLPPEIVPTGRGLLDDETWRWWLAEGRQTNSFDVHLRLAHLRDRLGALLELPEYRVLWQPPYLDPLTAVSQGQNLLWRLPDPRQRLAAYTTGQLLALTTLLTVWPADRPPLLLFLHELEVGGGWLEYLQSLPVVKLIVSGTQVTVQPPGVEPDTGRLISRLDEASARQLEAGLPDDIKATDLRRLPANRLLLQRGADVCTIDWE